MTKKSSLISFVLALILYFGLASFQESPGYMDADYHLYMGQRLAEGNGFTENILWNYLDDPIGLPHASHIYWPPLPSMLAALGIKLFPSLDLFQAARIPFIVLAALIPALTGKIAHNMFGKKRLSYFASAIALFSPFYLPYLSTTDTFSPTMFFGALIFLLLSHEKKKLLLPGNLVFLGALSALMYLSRAEGIIWFPLILIVIFHIQRKSKTPAKLIMQRLFQLTLGFLVISIPWFARNLRLFNSLFAPGGLRTIWLTEYNELFSFPVSALTLSSWLDSSVNQIIQTRLSALGQNALATIAIIGSILLFPMLLSGLGKSRKLLPTQLALFAWLIIFFSMTFIFPFSGARGGYFHAAAALQPVFWSIAALGMGNFINWGVKTRDWKKDRAWNMFGSGLLIFIVALSAYIFSLRVISADLRNPSWNISSKHYAEISTSLEELALDTDQIVLVNNPPAFALQSGRSAIVIPNGGLESLIAVAKKYGSSILILEKDHPTGLDSLYLDPSLSTNFSLIETIGTSFIFSIRDLD